MTSSDFVIRYLHPRFTGQLADTGSDADINHAFAHALARVDYNDDEHPPRYALLGPDRSANMIELVVIVADVDRHVIIHAMRARPSFLGLLEEFGETT